MAAKRKRKGTKMKIGECRLTKAGRKFCKTSKGVRFVKGGSTLSGSTTRRRKRGSCKRFKRVTVKGIRGKQRRCAAYN